MFPDSGSIAATEGGRASHDYAVMALVCFLCSTLSTTACSILIRVLMVLFDLTLGLLIYYHVTQESTATSVDLRSRVLEVGK